MPPTEVPITTGVAPGQQNANTQATTPTEADLPPLIKMCLAERRHKAEKAGKSWADYPNSTSPDGHKSAKPNNHNQVTMAPTKLPTTNNVGKRERRCNGHRAVVAPGQQNANTQPTTLVKVDLHDGMSNKTLMNIARRLECKNFEMDAQLKQARERTVKMEKNLEEMHSRDREYLAKQNDAEMSRFQMRAAERYHEDEMKAMDEKHQVRVEELQREIAIARAQRDAALQGIRGCQQQLGLQQQQTGAQDQQMDG
ncbi:hypothetical protein IMZ48_41720 [Candidatus Bathyarchaeota archaeon]|nr:hypothetical protein [Candidatus Bathyarchaeota archaeon]